VQLVQQLGLQQQQAQQQVLVQRLLLFCRKRTRQLQR
jgi:hypothetical protein